MQVTKTAKSPTQVSLTISAAAAELEPIRRHVLRHFATRVKVPGFRPGKAPMNIVEKNVDQKALLDEFMEHAINDLYGKALDQESIRPISKPEVQLKKFVPFTELEFTAGLETLSPIALPEYKKIKLAKPKVTIAAKDVTEVLESLKTRAAERIEVDRSAKTGDEVMIDFSGKDEKSEPITGTDGKDYPLLLGSKSFIPGFEENLTGLKAGDSKEITVTFPKDYQAAAMQGRKVTFSVDVKKVNELQLPKLDDVFASKVGPFKNLAELKADIKKQLTAEKQQQADRAYENELIKTLADKSKVDVPLSLIEEQLMQMEDEEKRNLVYRGQTWPEHLKEEGITEEEHRQRNRPQAAERVKAGLVLSEIASKEDLTVTPEELDLRIQILKGQYSDLAMQAELDKPENRQDITARMLTEKTINALVNYASK